MEENILGRIHQEMHIKFHSNNLKGEGLPEDNGTDGIIILKWVLTKYAVRDWTGLHCSG
jgi:hypothetical protein